VSNREIEKKKKMRKARSEEYLREIIIRRKNQKEARKGNVNSSINSRGRIVK